MTTKEQQTIDNLFKAVQDLRTENAKFREDVKLQVETTSAAIAANPVLAVVNQSEPFEDFYRRQIQEGFISEDGTPLKCECGCTDFKRVNEYFGEGYVEEYSLECKNENCLKLVGTWSYGNWQV